jgi:molecular chaperone HtpG
MDDDFDEVVVPTIGTYKETELKAINRSDAGEDLKDKTDKNKEKELAPLLEKIKGVLGERVKDVRVSVRLSDSPSCIVVDESDPTMQMQSLLKAMGQSDMPETKPILEVNPEHEILSKIKGTNDDALINDVSFLLLDQALLVEGIEIKEPADFVKRLNRVLQRAL